MKHGNFMMNQVEILELKSRILDILEIKNKCIILKGLVEEHIEQSRGNGW